MKRYFVFIIITILYTTFVCAQSRTAFVEGKIIDQYSRKPVEFVNILVVGTTIGSVTDSLGNFKLKDVPHGIVKFRISGLGYKTLVTSDYIISLKPPYVEVAIEEESKQLGEVTVTAPSTPRVIESPVSLRVIQLKDIEKMPGGNRDISRIVRSYPGVSFSPIGYRNDLIVRGGGPSENKFYMDGIEIPNINHFSTQGASGGPVSLVNSDLVRDINFYTGAFPANSGGALSSVMDFRLRDGNRKENTFKGTLGASEASFSGSGPINKKTTYLFSIRQSYLQLLFKMFGLPFLPNYIDGQFKIKTNFDEKNELILLGLTGIDRMKLNKDQTGDNAEYILSYLPEINQETFTLGASYRHYGNNSMQTLTVSHNYLNNKNTKYINNDDSSEDNLRLLLKSTEQKTSFRAENSFRTELWNIRAGIDAAYFTYKNNTRQLNYQLPTKFDEYSTNLGKWIWGAYIMANYSSADNRFVSSLGIRADGCSYGKLANPLDNLSPRLSLKYALTDEISIAASSGIYYQLPSYTSLGYMENGILANKDLKYMRSFHFSGGMEWRVNKRTVITAETFYKRYSNIPLSIKDNIPLTCKGDDYGIIGDEALISSALGSSYGLEIMGNYNFPERLNITGAVTIFKSQFKNNKESDYIRSAWDNKFIVNLSAIKSFKREWMAGAKITYLGGAPYTPYDIERTSLVEEWDKRGKAYLDYSLYNTLTRANYYQIDVRVDKSYYFKKWMLGLYIDIQNITGSILKEPDTPLSTGEIENPSAPTSQQKYKLRYIKQDSGTMIPTLGVTIEF